MLKDVIFEAEAALEDRLLEVESYFNFIDAIIAGDCTLYRKESSVKNSSLTIDSDLRLTLMSIGYVVLYNLIESTLRNYIVAIYEDMIQNGARIEEAKENVREVVLKGFKKRMDTSKLKNNVNDLSIQIIKECWDVNDLFSGNVDHRQIKKASLQYGFKLPNWSRSYGHGETLELVKSNRNDIAHGLKSFRECVENDSIDGLLQVKKQVVAYLKALTKNISSYIVKKEYLISPPRHEPVDYPQ